MADSEECELRERGCCYRVKSSNRLIVAVVCIAMFTDSLLLTLVDPILPKMLLRIEMNNRELSSIFIKNATTIKPSVILVDESDINLWQNDLFDATEQKTDHSINYAKHFVNVTLTTYNVSRMVKHYSRDMVRKAVSFPTATNVNTKETHSLSTNSRESEELNKENVTDIVNNFTTVLKDSFSNDLNNGGRFGYLVAAKGAAQFFCNPFVGHIISRFGYRRPMLIGSFLLAGSTLAFAYSISYWMLMVCRVSQGLASSLTAVTSLGLAADSFRDDTERGKVVGYAFGGLSLGIIAGPLYGSLLYDFVSPEFPFQLLSGIIFMSMVVQLFSFKKQKIQNKQSPAAIFHLIKDPYILIVAANIFLLNLDASLVLAFLPLELMRLSDPPIWKLGIVVLPTSVGYLFAGVVCPRIIHVVPRWVQGLAGIVISAGTLIALAYAFTFINMIIVTSFLGLAIGTISTSMQPLFAYIVDIRHNDVYGNVYAISDMAVCLAMFIGPLVGGPVLYAFNFQSLLFGAAVLDLLCAPLCVFLRNPARKHKRAVCDEEKEPLLTDADNNQIEYTDLDKIEYYVDSTPVSVKDDLR